MQVFVHIGLPQCGAAIIQATLDDKRNQLIKKGVLYPRTPGRTNHTRLFMAVTDPGHVDPLRWHQGYGAARSQADLTAQLGHDLAAEIAESKPDKLILSAQQFSASLASKQELERLHAMLAPYADQFRIIIHVDEQARVLARHYADQIFAGRTHALDVELGIAAGKHWRRDCLAAWPDPDPSANLMPEVQSPPFWLDYESLVKSWEDVLGAGSVSLRPFDANLFASPDVTREICQAFELSGNIGKSVPRDLPRQPSAAWLTRSRQLNAYFAQCLASGRVIPRQMWQRMLAQLEIDGAPIKSSSLHRVSATFAKANARLLKTHDALPKACLTPDKKSETWTEAAPGGGFRATQYMTVFLPIIDQATKDQRRREKRLAAAMPDAAPRQKGALNGVRLSPGAAKLMPPLARANFTKLQGGRFAPHNNVGRVNETELAPPYDDAQFRKLARGSTGTLIVACMKNEGPYIVEWIAYHRAIGVDNFLIYSNNCDDGTSEILDQLQHMGVVQHGKNDAWRGNSPQQFALSQSLAETLVKDAEWIIHIDADEFINVRTGNGTLPDFLDHVPNATNVAMTWRLFGHNGITRFQDLPVIEQFDGCAPKYCPKPHTVWGFKTMFKNIGAYAKISCHRPNNLNEVHRDRVVWVNGSGAPLGDAIKDRGWRSEIKSVGYDLIQLNHYALRSAESFLIKRQRGRALHVDRSIGFSYWVRMDWSDQTDLTIKRNLPRMGREMARLLGDRALKSHHDAAVAWHHAKAAELHQTPEFANLYAQALDTRLTEMERVAYALALDMEN
jgi:hypothetical protein